MKCSGFVQPEVLYFPERGFGTEVFSWKVEDAVNSLLFREEVYRNAFSWNKILGWNMLWGKFRLEDVEFSKNPHLIYAQFITSFRYSFQNLPFLNSLTNL